MVKPQDNGDNFKEKVSFNFFLIFDPQQRRRPKENLDVGLAGCR